METKPLEMPELEPLDEVEMTVADLHQCITRLENAKPSELVEHLRWMKRSVARLHSLAHKVDALRD